MFFRKKGHSRSNPILGLFRLLLSLIIMAILAVGLLQAYKAFSGYDPTQMSPKATLKSLLTSQGAYEFAISLLTFNPGNSLNKAKQALHPGGVDTNQGSVSSSPLQYRFAIIADSHKDYSSLAKALKQSKDEGAKFVIGIGDLSDVGTMEELKQTKEQFDLSGLPYYISPGDHDLWDSRDKTNDALTNFREVFGSPYQSFSYNGQRFIMIDNSDNYIGIDELQLQWIEDQLKQLDTTPKKTTFVVSDIPLFHPSSDHVMGKTTEKLKSQAEHLLLIFKKAGVDQIFAADTHFFSEFVEPKNDLKITTVGAVTTDKNPQTPRFVLVDIFEDGSYNIESAEVK